MSLQKTSRRALLSGLIAGATLMLSTGVSFPRLDAKVPIQKGATPGEPPRLSLTPDEIPPGALVPKGVPPALGLFATGDVVGFIEPCG